MELRKRPKPDYRRLDRGEDVLPKSGLSVGDDKWPTSKLWRLEIIEERLVDGVEQLRVHYSGWSNVWDEWRPKSEIIDTPSEHELSDAYLQFVSQIKIKVKERLNLSRLEDPEVSLQIPVQQETFEIFVANIGAQLHATKGVRKILRASLSSWSSVLGDNWWWRIGNEAGDFAYIKKDTLQLWITERQPLVEYTKDLKRRLVHRGYICVVRFVKRTGNSSDMVNIINSKTK